MRIAGIALSALAFSLSSNAAILTLNQATATFQPTGCDNTQSGPGPVSVICFSQDFHRESEASAANFGVLFPSGFTPISGILSTLNVDAAANMFEQTRIASAAASSLMQQTQQLVVFGGAGSGTLSLVFEFAGGGAAVSPSPSVISMSFAVSVNGPQLLSFACSPDPTGFSCGGVTAETATVNVPFTFGVPFNLTQQLTANATEFIMNAPMVDVSSGLLSYSVAGQPGAVLLATPEPATLLLSALPLLLVLRIRFSA